MKRHSVFILIVAALVSACSALVHAQTTAFTYQGRLTDGAAPASGTYDIQFSVYDAATGGTQQGATQTFDGNGSRPAPVQVSNGLFTVRLDFGSAPFSGEDRFLEIAVRPHGSDPNAPYTTLAPRQPLTSTPYAIRSRTAGDSEKLGGVAAGSYVQDTDPRLTDARTPSSGSPAYIQNGTGQQVSSNFNISGDGKVGGTLSATTVDATTQFNIGGKRVLSVPGTGNFFGGESAGQGNTTGSYNTIVGLEAGALNGAASNNAFFGAAAGRQTTVGENSFFGTEAGRLNSTGAGNAFFGRAAGYFNSTGSYNSFFGGTAGYLNSTGEYNSYFGHEAGLSNRTGSNNTFFGAKAGQQSTADDNAFFGAEAGLFNTTGSFNASFGRKAGVSITTGSHNTFVGADADASAGDLTYATAVGSGTVVSSSHTIVLGTAAESVKVPGDLNVGGSINGNFTLLNAAQFKIDGKQLLGAPGTGNFFGGENAGLNSTTGSFNTFVGKDAGDLNTTGSSNAFFGATAGRQNTASDNAFFGTEAGRNNSTGSLNAFFGRAAGYTNTTGGSNSFFGASAGWSNTTGGSNSFFGASAGWSNTTGQFNSYFGYEAGRTNATGSANTFFGAAAGLLNTAGENSFFGTEAGRFSTTGAGNAFFGNRAGYHNETGAENSAFGSNAGINNTTGSSNAFFGGAAGGNNTTGSHNTFVGANVDASAGDLTYATAIGSGAVVSTSNTIALGRADGSDHIRVFGLGSAGTTQLCRNTNNEISNCSSSLRYKTNISPFSGGLNLVRRLRPITFDWKQGGHHDLGLGAEEVEKVEPLLVTYDGAGRVEGVKYDRVAVVLLNAVREQQAQIEAQQKQIEEQKKLIDGLKGLVCAQNASAAICQ